MASAGQTQGPDFSKGISVDTLKNGGSLLGHVGNEPVLLVKQEGEYFAVGAVCTHYNGPLQQGIIEGETIHCPWHHSCFDLRTGEVVKAPALNPIAAWNIEVHDERVFVTDKKNIVLHSRLGTEKKRFVIIGAGAAGTSAAVMLRRHGFLGSIHLVEEGKDLPYDRPNLSKDFLSGNAPESWVPLYPLKFYNENKINLELNCKAEKIDSYRHHILLSNGKTLPYDRCLLSTGGYPRKPAIAGIDKPHVYVLRTLTDCRRLIARTSWAFRAVIIGSGFIAMEAAAALRMRNIEVSVVAPDELPLIKVLGVHVASYLKKIHEKHGVKFYGGHTVKEIRDRSVLLDDNQKIDCDFILVGAGIELNTELAAGAGCNISDGITVDEFLETTVPDIFAAGDIANWPDLRSQRPIRVEHWEVAERQGQIAALNMLGDRVKFEDVPFFWTKQYDMRLRYVGYSDCFDRMDVMGDMNKDNFAVAFYEDQRVAALLTVGRDKENLLVEQALKEGNDEKLHYVLKEYERLNSLQP
ncbi:MAG: FAD-dependent oxidoreductase [Bdellovibrio sp.]